MSKKLSGNGLWDSSRMIIPQHKEAVLAWNHTKYKRTKPQLDEQELELISLAIGESYSQETKVTLEVFDLDENVTVEGVVRRIDQRDRRILIDHNGDAQWILIKDIIAVI